MKFFATVRVTKSFRRGSALLLALVLTMALFIMGLVFVSTTQIEKETVSRVDELQTLDTAVDTVIGRINNVLVGDLFGDDPCMLNNDASDEYYDYPGPDDPWLASLEPMTYSDNGTPDPIDDWCFWRHITDLYGNFDGIGTNDHPCTAGAGAWYYSPKDRSIAEQWDSTSTTDSFPHAINYTGGNYYFVGRIVGEYEGTETILDGDDWDNPSVPEAIWPWGAQADADGDGVADSRWVKVPNLTGPRGQNVYTAVRIVDNGGMININTAYRYPDPAYVTNGTPQWDGSQLSHINLQGIISQTDLTNGLSATTIQGVRYGVVMPTVPDDTHYDYDTKYEIEVAKRILNPLTPIAGENYLPFDISDELELRNRFFLNSFVATRLGYRDDSLNINICQATFKPGTGGVGKELPYTIGDDIGSWFGKLKPDIEQVTWNPGDSVIGDYNRRFFSTTYNFDRVMVPKPNGWDTNMPADLIAAWESWTAWNDTDNKKWSYRPVCVNDYDSSATDPCAVTLEQIAAAIWLGLPDGSMIKDLPQFDTMSWSDAECRERLACQMAVNMVDYRDIDNKATDFNPGGGADHYYGYEYNGENPYISMIAVALYDDDTSTPPSGLEETHYAVEIYNPGPTQIDDLSNFTLEVIEDTTGTTTSYTLPAETVNAKSSIVLVDSTTGNGFTLGGVVEIGGAIPFVFTSNDRLKLIDHTNNDVVHDYIEDIGAIPVQANNGLEEYEARRKNGPHVIDGGTDFKFPVWPEGLDAFLLKIGGLTLYTGWTPANDVPIQLAGKNAPFKTIGELFNVLSIGTMDIGGTYYTIPEFWEHFYDPTGNPDPCDVAAGKIDAADPCFVNLTRFLTVFNPFSDSIDNDGNGLSDDPCDDGVDNDRDGLLDYTNDHDEIFANFGEHCELAVAGRININTAPWFVIAQLPWIVDPYAAAADEYKLAQAIVAYRDKTTDSAGIVDYTIRQTGMTSPDTVREDPGFANIAELLNVTQNLDQNQAADEYYDIRRYGRNGNNDNASGNPPFYSTDVANDDLLERDIIFQRISNLITVRSDVFTAYIMVRVGELGPQKRVIAIFDRSNVYNSGDTPKLVALHPVPDPR